MSSMKGARSPIVGVLLYRRGADSVVCLSQRFTNGTFDMLFKPHSERHLLVEFHLSTFCRSIGNL